MKRWTMIGLTLLCLFVTVPGYAGDEWVLYDDFNSASIDPNKWTAQESGSTGRETARKVVKVGPVSKEQLYLNLLERSYGYTTTDSGLPSAGTQVIFANSSNIRAIKAAVKLVKIKTIGCDTNGDPTWVAANLIGSFLNTGPQTAGSRQNDVYAWIGIWRDSESSDDNGTARVGIRVKRCTNATCSSTVTAYSGSLGTIKEGQQAVLSVEWDEANHKFIFQRVGQQPVVFTMPAVQGTLAPTVDYKKLMASTEVPNCTSSPRPTGFINVLFRNVYIKTK